jgi:hypothetical protein
MDPVGTAVDPEALVADLLAAIGQHKVWARADLGSASAVPPAR